MPGAQTGPVSVMRMFGVTAEGNSVCCHIHGFTPYFFVSLPDTFKETDCKPFKEKLNSAVVADMRSNKENITEAVLAVEIVHGKSLMEYQGDDDQTFAKITVALPRLIAPSKRLLRTQVIYPPADHHEFTDFESNVDIDMRFMVDTHVLGCSWIEIPAGKWSQRGRGTLQVMTMCQMEIDVAYDAFIAHAPEGDWARVAPFRIHSFDIECAGRRGIFPEPKVDPVIQIANVVKLHGAKENLICNVFTLKSCAPIGHAEVYEAIFYQHCILNIQFFLDRCGVSKPNRNCWKRGGTLCEIWTRIYSPVTI